MPSAHAIDCVRAALPGTPAAIATHTGLTWLQTIAALHVLVGRGRAVRAVTGCYQPTGRA
jgi:hypothetical protein